MKEGSVAAHVLSAERAEQGEFAVGFTSGLCCVHHDPKVLTLGCQNVAIQFHAADDRADHSLDGWPMLIDRMAQPEFVKLWIHGAQPRHKTE